MRLLDRAHLLERLAGAGCPVVPWSGPRTLELVPDAVPATEDDWPAEYLDLILAIRVVRDLDEAVTHIRTHGSSHTEAIVTTDHRAAMRFVHQPAQIVFRPPLRFDVARRDRARAGAGLRGSPRPRWGG